MEKMFFTNYHEGEKAFYISSTNQKGEEKDVCNYMDTWNSLWKEKNAEFETFLAEDPNFY